MNAYVFALNKQDFDLVRMDVQMPEMDDFEATQKIRNSTSHHQNNKIPIIAMIVRAMKEDQEKCINGERMYIFPNPLRVLIVPPPPPPPNDEIIVGGDMESGDAWTVLNVSPQWNLEPIAISTTEFGYTDDGPAAGEGGCFHATGATTNPQLNTAVYQKVTINRGELYDFNLAFKNTVDMVNFWFEAYYSLTEPQLHQEWMENAEDDAVEAVMIGGWTDPNWFGGCMSRVDGTLAENECRGVYAPIMIEGTGTVDIYIGFKIGCGWADLTYDLTVDNVSLIGRGTGSAVQVNSDRSPEDFRLSQNYPNPFNPTTHISYELKQAGNVTLNIYNNLGQVINTLVNANQSAGSHDVIWDGTNMNGDVAATGVYFYELKVAGQTSIRKMVLKK